MNDTLRQDPYSSKLAVLGSLGDILGNTAMTVESLWIMAFVYIMHLETCISERGMRCILIL